MKIPRIPNTIKASNAQNRMRAQEDRSRRVAAIVVAQTSERAAEVMADLPPLPGDGPPGRLRRGRGHGDAAAAAVDWKPTGERFRDPRTNRVMRVWEDSAGGRHYVAEDQG